MAYHFSMFEEQVQVPPIFADLSEPQFVVKGEILELRWRDEPLARDPSPIECAHELMPLLSPISCETISVGDPDAADLYQAVEDRKPGAALAFLEHSLHTYRTTRTATLGDLFEPSYLSLG